jgi:hypothetical protein
LPLSAKIKWTPLVSEKDDLARLKIERVMPKENDRLANTL